MRSAETVFEELEEDRASREKEIRLVENVIARSESEEEQEMLRRSLVLLTYAHLEGFCKFSLSVYASAVNALRIPCRDASVPLVAITLSSVLAALRDSNKKHPAFSRLINDRDLHLLAREQSFIENFEKIIARIVEIPDHAVDTKSNLSSIVLKRNLYQLGLRYPIVAKEGSKIDRLCGVRNAIAHGDKLKRPREKEVKEYLMSAFEVMKFVQDEIFAALKGKVYQRDPSRPFQPLIESSSLINRAIEFLGANRH